jgi:uncharacterized protein
MIDAITQENLDNIKNPVFASYASIYTNIYANYIEQISQSGIDMEPADPRPEILEKVSSLQDKQVCVRNDNKSLYINNISPACLACQTGKESLTFILSLQCNRSCYYCFNPNQEYYDIYKSNQRDAVAEIEEMAANRKPLKHIALTGGEPLLHKAESVAFFSAASRLYPKAYTRLYTCGDLVDEHILAELQQAGLNEIRFSIRLHDLEKGHRQIYDKIALAKQYIPYVMVEMPVLPGSYDIMTGVLLELERLEIFSINLLEFCYPFNNPDAFRQRGFRIKTPPFRVLYNYWYAGGLPVAGSERVCLDLLEFALDQGLKLGVHYCSLENKHTGQIYQQNANQRFSRLHTFSKKDYFLKSAKVFGDDIPLVRQVFKRAGFTRFETNLEYDYLEFPVQKIQALKKLDVEIGLSTNVVEIRDGEKVLRELSLALTTPKTFDPTTDI